MSKAKFASPYLIQRLEALERQNALLKAAIKESWGFVKYNLPLSLEIEVAKQASLKAVKYNRRVFKQLLDVVLNESVKILQETNEPVHYTVIVEAVKRNHKAMLQEAWTRDDLGDKASLDGKVRDLATMGFLVRVGKGMYFYGPKLAEKQTSVEAEEK